jgi:hypothetical protein
MLPINPCIAVRIRSSDSSCLGDVVVGVRSPPNSSPPHATTPLGETTEITPTPTQFLRTTAGAWIARAASARVDRFDIGQILRPAKCSDLLIRYERATCGLTVLRLHRPPRQPWRGIPQFRLGLFRAHQKGSHSLCVYARGGFCHWLLVAAQRGVTALRLRHLEPDNRKCFGLSVHSGVGDRHGRLRQCSRPFGCSVVCWNFFAVVPPGLSLLVRNLSPVVAFADLSRKRKRLVAQPRTRQGRVPAQNRRPTKSGSGARRVSGEGRSGRRSCIRPPPISASN